MTLQGAAATTADGIILYQWNKTDSNGIYSEELGTAVYLPEDNRTANDRVYYVKTGTEEHPVYQLATAA